MEEAAASGSASGGGVGARQAVLVEEVGGEGDASALVDSDMVCIECPAERDVTPLDLLPDTPADAEVLFVVGTQQGKVTRIGGLEKLPALKVGGGLLYDMIGLFLS